MKRQRIAVVTPGSFVIPSGHSSSVERVIEKVVPLAADQFDIRIYGIQDRTLNKHSMLGKVPCYRLPGGRQYVCALLRHLQGWRPDKIDVHNRPLFALKLKERLTDSQVFLTLHSTTFLSTATYSKSLIRLALSSVDGVIVNSEFLRELLFRRYPGLETPVLVNHLGCSIEDFIPRWTPVGEAMRSARLSDLGWGDRKIILYLGRLLPSKGVHHILDALPLVLEQEPDAMLLIVGSVFYGKDRETEYVRRLKEQAKAYGNRVVFLPFVPYPKVADWYNLADVVTVPSGQEEAFGLVNIEAMASAVPVIASRSGGIPEIVSDGDTGYLLSASEMDQRLLGDRIVRLLGSKEEREAMGRAGRELLRRRFRWQHTAQRWIDIMTSI